MQDDDAITIEAFDAAELLNSRVLLTEWDRLLQDHVHVNALYASTAWVAHLAASTNSPVRVLFARDRSGRLVGVAPVRLRKYALSFDISGRTLFRRNLRTAEILGSIPILPENPALHADMVARILSDWPHCGSIYLDAIPTDSCFWKYLRDGRGLPRGCRLHMADGPRPWHLARLAPSYEHYLKSMSSKARANMRREARQLGQAAGGEIRTHCVTSPDQVKWFLQCAAGISRGSWQHRVLGERIGCGDAARKSFEDLAARGILRSYLLQAGEVPCAFVVGYQHQGVYHYAEIGFDERHGKYSPGKILLSLILEDLHEQQCFETLNFGVGDASYKRRFGNHERCDASCLIMRKRVGNLLLARSHAMFNGGVRIAKKLLGRKVEK